MEPVAIQFFRSEGSDQRRFRAFSLLELLVVVAFIGALFTLAVPSLRSVLEGQRLTSAGNRIASFMERARVHSTTLQRTVAMRFFMHATPPAGGGLPGVKAVQLLEVVSAVNPDGTTSLSFQPMMTPYVLEEAVYIGPSSSSAFANMTEGATAFQGATLRYYEFYFFPNGTVSLSPATPNPYLTVSTLRDREALVDPFVLSLDPVTTRVTSFRP